MGVQIIQGDCRDVLKTLETESVQCVVTSPPYFNLRDYHVEGQLGSEASVDDYLDQMDCVFNEVWRVLRKDGTLWLNLGDSYAGSGKGPTGQSGLGAHETRQGFHSPQGEKLFGRKPKDLFGLPWLVALSLQFSGWYLRSDIIWHKPNPMPESVTDRPTRAHEYIFLMSKSERYYYDAAAIREPAKAPYTKMPDGWDTGPGAHGSFHRQGREKGACVAYRQRGHRRRHDGFNDRWDQMSKDEQQAAGVNKRDVWMVATHPYPEAHFATFPEKLIEPCILAGSAPGDVVLDPFAGSGTTLKVATKHRRSAIGIELSAEYCDLIEKRMANVPVTLPMEDAS